LQAKPEQTVSGPEAPIGTSEDAQLVAQGENLEEEVEACEQGRPERRDHAKGVTHRP
jgi:hypothetical protein